jgi:hypothetical protein
MMNEYYQEQEKPSKIEEAQEVLRQAKIATILRKWDTLYPAKCVGEDGDDRRVLRQLIDEHILYLIKYTGYLLP